MGRRRATRGFAAGLLAVIVALGSPAFAGPTIERGWGLFETLPGTSFGGIPFIGVPLGSFDFTTGTGGDFGRGIGTHSTGATDTIVKRLDVATVADPVIPIELVALHLQSAVPVDLGLGLGVYFLTLQSERGGPVSTGQMTINGLAAEGSPHGTFDLLFDIAYDIRLGSLNGPIAVSNVEIIGEAGVPWNHVPPPGALEIPDVNIFLNGTDRLADFWPVDPFTETGSLIHIVRSTREAVPAPGAVVLLGLGVLTAAVYRWRERRRAKET